MQSINDCPARTAKAGRRGGSSRAGGGGRLRSSSPQGGAAAEEGGPSRRQRRRPSRRAAAEEEKRRAELELLLMDEHALASRGAAGEPELDMCCRVSLCGPNFPEKVRTLL